MPADGARKPGHQRDQRGLAGAVGAEQAGDAGADGHRDAVDGDDVAVPPRDVVEADRRSCATGPRDPAVADHGCRPRPTAADQAPSSRRRTRASSRPPVGGVRRVGVGRARPSRRGTRVYGENRPATSPTRGSPCSLGDALDGRDDAVADAAAPRSSPPPRTRGGRSRRRSAPPMPGQHERRAARPARCALRGTGAVCSPDGELAEQRADVQQQRSATQQEDSVAASSDGPAATRT